jgi:RHS repeat-associated protein
VRRSGSDQLLAQEDYDAGEDETVQTLWALGDHQGSVRDYVTFDGVDTTTVAVHYTLDSFGNVLDGDTSGIRYIYTGQEFDAETGNYYYDARYYDPSVGRFLSEDPIGYAGDVSNVYRYVGNAATMYVDPSGLAFIHGVPPESPPTSPITILPTPGGPLPWPPKTPGDDIVVIPPEGGGGVDIGGIGGGGIAGIGGGGIGGIIAVLPPAKPGKPKPPSGDEHSGYDPFFCPDPNPPNPPKPARPWYTHPWWTHPIGPQPPGSRPGETW